MVLVLIFAVLAQVVTGLFTADTDTGMVNGPLALKVADKWVERATDFHAWWINILLILVAIHVAAVVLYLVWKRHNLIGAMITGRKRIDQAVEPGAAAPRLAFASSRLAMSVLLACAALVYFIVRAGG
jgi:cytochrome b